MAKKSEYRSAREKAFIERAAETKYPTDRLGPGSLMTMQSHINSSRLIMTNQQLTHMVNIKNPEFPLVATGFEDTLADFSTMITRTNAQYKIVRKFVKNKYNYVLIGFDEEKRIYHAWKRTELEEHSEGFSTRYNNSYMDSLEVGDIVPEDEVLRKSESFDRYMNYRYGKNLNTIYLTTTQVLEDGIMVMNGAENMMNTFRCTTHEIGIADNEILLNWYGDDDEYQGLPRIGEKTKKGIICAVRRIDNARAPYALKKKYLRHIERGDRKQYGTGRVIDVDILYNRERSDLSEIGANKMLLDMYDHQQKYYDQLWSYMMDIVDHCDEENATYTDEFTIICEEAHDFIDATAFFADNNDSIFGNMRIVVRLMDEEPLRVGSKLVGRHGNKGVITRIVPPEESWHMEDGSPVHVVVTTLGIVGRLNQSQMNEFSINELTKTAIEMMTMTDKLDDKIDIVCRLMKHLNSDEGKALKKYFKNLSRDDQKKFCRRIERDGIVVIQDPIDNADITDIGKAYNEFPADWQRVVFEDGVRSMKKILWAKMFYMRLKQDPIDKYSARSRGPVNPLTTLPAKSNNKKRGIQPVSDVPVRLGEYELEVLLAMVNHPALIARFMTENSTSYQAKLAMAEQAYLGDVDEDIDLSSIKFVQKKNMEAIAAYNNVLGTEIQFDVEYAPEGEYFTD